ncbi:MAG: caspase family protein [Xanthomonadales bacterium]|nr:caspase family protein [Xanthomonadales bacterium]
MPRRPARALAAATLAWLVSAAPWIWLPSDPPLAPAEGGIAVDESPAPSAEEPAHALAFDPEQVMFDQRALLDAGLGALRPQTPGQPDLYVVAFAGDAEEAVFGNEADYVQRLFSTRFGAQGRVLVLENNPETTAQRPLATWTNLHYALQAIAQIMDPAEDILLVYLSSHGSEEHELLVDLDPLPLDQIGPADLAEALATEPPMPSRVVIVNACYSGGFVDALRGESSLVITSARADRTSFGCGADADITWFGRAFLVDALNRTTSMRQGFELARSQVAEWEHAEGEEPSEPQIATTPAIEAKLERWRATLPEAPAVPFSPSNPSGPEEPGQREY